MRERWWKREKHKEENKEEKCRWRIREKHKEENKEREGPNSDVD